MDNQRLVALTVDLVSTFVANHNIRADEIPDLLAKTHAAMASLTSAASDEPEAVETPATGAVSVRKSLASRDFIVSMIDGKPYRTLKRHLAGHGLTPDEYRARYGLRPDYPMVAPGYSEQRSATAKRLGLGRKKVTPPPAPTAPKRTPLRRGETPAK